MFSRGQWIICAQEFLRASGIRIRNGYATGWE